MTKPKPDITIDNVDTIFPTHEEEVVQIQTSRALYATINKAVPTPAYFKASAIRIAGAKTGDKLGDISLCQLTKLINAHLPVVATFVTFQVALESFVRRSQKIPNRNNYTTYELLDFNNARVKPPNSDEPALPAFQQLMWRTKDGLQNFTAALQHSFAQTFVFQELAVLQYKLMYEDKVPHADRTDPRWKDLMEKLPLTKSKPLGNFPAKQRVNDFLKHIGYDKNQIERFFTAVIILIHHQELDATFQLFELPAQYLPPRQSEQAPINGAQSKMLRLTDQVGIFVRFPNYISMKENITIFSGMSSDNFYHWKRFLPDMLTYYLSGATPFREQIDGFYPQTFRFNSMLNYYATLLDGTVSLVAAHFVEEVLPNTEWRSLYHKGFAPTPCSTTQGKFPQSYVPSKKLEIYKGLLASGYYVFPAHYLQDIPLVTVLIPGPETLHERMENVKQVAPALDAMFMTRYLYEKERKRKEVLHSQEFKQLSRDVQQLAEQKKEQDQLRLFPTSPRRIAPPREAFATRRISYTPPPIVGPSRTAPVPVATITIPPSPDHSPSTVNISDCTPAAAADLVTMEIDTTTVVPPVSTTTLVVPTVTTATSDAQPLPMDIPVIPVSVEPSASACAPPVSAPIPPVSVESSAGAPPDSAPILPVSVESSAGAPPVYATIVPAPSTSDLAVPPVLTVTSVLSTPTVSAIPSTSTIQPPVVPNDPESNEYDPQPLEPTNSAVYQPTPLDSTTQLKVCEDDCSQAPLIIDKLPEQIFQEPLPIPNMSSNMSFLVPPASVPMEISDNASMVIPDSNTRPPYPTRRITRQQAAQEELSDDESEYFSESLSQAAGYDDTNGEMQ